VANVSLLAATSVFRALDDVGDDDYDLVAETILALAETPIPPQAKKLHTTRVNLRLADGRGLNGPFFVVRCRSSTGGQRGGFRTIYAVDHAHRRVCIAKVDRRGDATYRDLGQLLKGARLRSFATPEDEPPNRRDR